MQDLVKINEGFSRFFFSTTSVKSFFATLWINHIQYNFQRKGKVGKVTFSMLRTSA